MESYGMSKLHLRIEHILLISVQFELHETNKTHLINYVKFKIKNVTNSSILCITLNFSLVKLSGTNYVFFLGHSSLIIQNILQKRLI